jgi:hypothetical protein
MSAFRIMQRAWTSVFRNMVCGDEATVVSRVRSEPFESLNQFRELMVHSVYNRS